ncbi:glycosyltransferase family A protein [Mobilicoccus sp.]|uniref:glycosyltransferase family 2 protein n=1 Tax=Mobilicoccus sp. TaxID=2034349 RepID=UPI0028B1CECB|nr:glycosyltransferase family A protein [Mobilicoccus sp.]
MQTVIGIPTYRRPEQLARLLASLVPEIDGHDVHVIVADNDAGAEAPAVVADSGLAALCVPVPEPGLSAVRNELIRTATHSRPGWTHLVMLDDDGRVRPGWFAALLEGISRYDGDVTAGPVIGELPPDASLLARNSLYAGRRRHESGPVDMLNGAQNIAVARRIVDRIGDPWFPPHLGRAGGEDHYLFRTVLELGGTLVWCDDAAVTEPTPANRLTSSAILRRAFRSNLVGSQTDLAFQGPARVARRLAVDTGWFVRKVVAGVVHRDPNRLASATIDAVCLAGRATGMIRRSTPSGGHAGGTQT